MTKAPLLGVGELAMCIAGLGFAIIPFASQELGRLGVSSLSVLLVRVVTTAIILGCLPKVGNVGGLPSRDRALAALNGMLLLLSFWTYYEAVVKGLSPTQAVSLVYLYPVWSLLAIMLLGTLANIRVAVSAVAASVAGAFLCAGFSFNESFPLAATILAILNGVLLAAMVGLYRLRAGAESSWLQFSRLSFIFSAILATVVACLGVAGRRNALEFPLSLKAVIWLGLIVCIGTLLPYVLIGIGARLARPLIGTILLLAEPVFVCGIQLMTGQTSHALSQVLGIALIASGALLAILASRAPYVAI